MSPTPTTSETCSPEMLQELLAWMTDASSGSGIVSGEDTSSSSYDILSHVWQPCTGILTVGQYLDTRQFPLSYRDLVRRWRQVGSPTLHSLRIPHGLVTPRNSNEADLCSIAEAQESAIIAALSHQQCSCTSFDSFASHVDVYAAVCAELSALEQQHDDDDDDDDDVYKDTYETLLNAFANDQQCCSVIGSHSCIGKLIWGETFAWPLATIKQQFERHQRHRLRPTAFVAAQQQHSPIITLFSPPMADASSDFGLFPLTTAATKSPLSSPLEQDINPWLDWSALLYELQKTSTSECDAAAAVSTQQSSSLSPSSSWRSDTISSSSSSSSSSWRSDSTPELSCSSSSNGDDNEAWLKHYQGVLQETVLQLTAAAELLSSSAAKVTRPSTQQQRVRSITVPPQQQHAWQTMM